MSFKVDFLAIGPQRTGTSWLDRVLRAHPGLALPSLVKETMFFDRRYDRRWNWYARQFEDASRRVVGEVAPTCFDSERALERIAEHNPECKIIVSLRDPVSRAISSYRHHSMKGRVGTNFSEAVQRRPRILTAGRYELHVPRWLDAFAPHSVAFLLMDDIAARPGHVVERVWRLLDVESIDVPNVASERIGSATAPRSRRVAKLAGRVTEFLRNRGHDRIVEIGKSLGMKALVYEGGDRLPPVRPEELEYLRSYYQSTIEYVESLLPRRLDEWHVAP